MDLDIASSANVSKGCLLILDSGNIVYRMCKLRVQLNTAADTVIVIFILTKQNPCVFFECIGVFMGTSAVENKVMVNSEGQT